MELKSLYEIKGMKSKNSVLKSMFVNRNPFQKHISDQNVHIAVEAYDDTFLNAFERKGEDYIIDMLQKELKNEKTKYLIKEHLELNDITGFLVTFYFPTGHSELIFMTNGDTLNEYINRKGLTA